MTGGKMPEPVRGDQRYVPGLDGLRALAVAVVVAYHLSLGWARGGLLGVAVFFTLSGYLITDILLGQWRKGGKIALADFWLRRARRLLPALFVMLATVTVWIMTTDQAQVQSLRGNVIASALYVSNWWYIGQHSSYFAQFAPPSPLDHLWSLAVEEQFYLLWPWLLLAGLLLLGRRGRGATGIERNEYRFLILAGLTVATATVSAAAMAILYHPGYDPTRIYEGTDTRAFGLLTGAALAMFWPSKRSAWPTARTWMLDAGGIAGLAVIAVLVWRTNEYSAFMFDGGLVLLSLATALVIAAAVHPSCRIGRALGWTPLRWTGVRSYGIYLWHYPVILLAGPQLTKSPVLSDVLLAALSTAIAALSWTFVESPIRRGTPWPRLTSAEVRKSVVPALAVGGVSLTVVTGVAASLHPLAGTGSGGLPKTGQALSVGDSGGAASPGRNPRAGARHVAAPITTPAGGTLRTSCRAVVHMGDSTSEGLISPNYLPNPAQRINARYSGIGITSEHMAISGGTSIVETINGQPNIYTLAQRLIHGGYRGCWVMALGTNDTADVFVGSAVNRVQRVNKMMSLIGNQPVMWVDVKSLKSSGPYSEQDMQLWNQALAAVAPRYPNMRIYDWAAVVQNSWFINDGIHYTSYGYAQRARLIADALATAFPADPAQGNTTAPSASPTATTSPRQNPSHQTSPRQTPSQQNPSKQAPAQQAPAQQTPSPQAQRSATPSAQRSTASTPLQTPTRTH